MRDLNTFFAISTKLENDFEKIFGCEMDFCHSLRSTPKGAKKKDYDIEKFLFWVESVS